MRKVFSIVAGLLLMGTATFAQNAKNTTKTTQTETKQSAATKTKKDGSPDMRYKDNKKDASAKTAPATKTKKDGTPDMRYKQNKPAGTK